MRVFAESKEGKTASRMEEEEDLPQSSGSYSDRELPQACWKKEKEDAIREFPEEMVPLKKEAADEKGMEKAAATERRKIEDWNEIHIPPRVLLERTSCCTCLCIALVLVILTMTYLIHIILC